MDGSNSRKVRSACDICHALKMKCSGGDPCTGCARSKQSCIYSEPNRLGRPKGSKNKKSQHQRTASKSPRSKPREKRRTESLGSDTSPKPSPTDQEVALGLDGLLSSGEIDGLQEFLEPNAFLDIDDQTIFPSAPMSETSWDQTPGWFQGLDSEMGLKPPGPSSSMFSLGEGDDFRQAMQAADLPFFPERPFMPQDHNFSALPRSKSVSDDMNLTDHCACIGNQAKFLSTLKKMEGKYSPTPVPIILQATQDSRILWERLMHCSSCRRDRDSVAVLMFAMGLRNIIRSLQCLTLSHQSSQHSISHPNSGLHAISGHGPTVFGNVPTPQRNGVSNQDIIFDNISSGLINHRSGVLIKDTIRVGSFEVPQEEQAFLTDILIARALSKIKSLLESMKGYLEKVSGTSFHSVEHGEKWPVHFILEDLQRSVLMTEGSVREIIQR